METYVSNLQRNSLELECDIVPVRQFLDGPSHVLLHVDKQTSVGMLKVYNILNSLKLDSEYSDYQCIFLSIDHIRLTQSLELCDVTAKYVIAIECNGVIGQPTIDDVSRLCTTLRLSNSKSKLILVSSSDSVLEWSIGPCEHSHGDGISLTDLSLHQRKHIINRKLILLQGKHISLAQINPDLSTLQPPHSLNDVISTDTLIKLVNNETVEADKQMTYSGVPQTPYIARTIKAEVPVVVKPIHLKTTFEYEHEIFAISNVKKSDFHQLSNDENEICLYKDLNECQQNNAFKFDQIRFVILDYNEAEIQFRDLCVIFQARTVHWLMGVRDEDRAMEELLSVVRQLSMKSTYDFEREIQLINSVGDAESLNSNFNIEDDLALIAIECRMLGKKYEPRFTESVSVEFKEICDNWKETSGTSGRLDSIIGPNGMGKSSFIKKRINKIKMEDDSLWVCNVDLAHSISKLKAKFDELERNSNKIDKYSVVDFLISVLDLKSEFEKRLFQYYIDQNKVVLFFDGFDEISDKYDKVVNKMVKVLIDETNTKQIWVCLRPYGEKKLEIKSRSLVLQEFSKEEQEIFIYEYLRQKLKEISVEFIELKKFVDKVLNLISKSDFYCKLTGNPLICRMLADVLLTRIQTSQNSLNLTDDIVIEMSSIYEKIIKMIYSEVYLGQKSDENSCNSQLKTQPKMNYDEYLHVHQLISLYTLMKDDLIQENILTEPETIDLNNIVHKNETGHERTGILKNFIDGLPQLIHKTLAEYFATLWFINQLKHDFKDRTKLLICFYKYVLEEGSLIALSILQRYETDEPNSHVLLTVIEADNDKNSVLFWAIKYEQLTLMSLIMDQLSNERLKVQILEGQLVHLATRKEIETAELLLKVIKTRFPQEITTFVNCETATRELPLHGAVFDGNLDMVRLLMANGANQRRRRYVDAQSPIDFAFRCDHAEIVEFFIKHVTSDSTNAEQPLEDLKTLLGHQDDNGNTVLHGAIVNDKMRTVDTLLKLNAPLNIQNSQGHTPLTSAVKCHNLTAVQLILNKPHDIEDIIKSAELISHTGIIEIFIQSIQCHFPNQLEKFIRRKNQIGNTLLHVAIELNDKNAVDSLIKLKTPMDMRNDKGHTPMSIAVAKDNANMVKTLLDSVTPYDVIAHAAEFINCGQIIVIIITYVSNHFTDKLTGLIDEKYENGNTLLHVAAKHNHVEATKLLIEKGANVNIKNKYKQTPLNYAIKCNKTDVAKILLENSSLLDIVGCSEFLCDEDTAINCLDLVEKKFPNDLNSFIKHKDRYGYTLPHVAAKFNWWKTVERLIRLKTDFGVKSKDGRTALCVALLHMRTAVVTLLTHTHVIGAHLEYSVQLRHKEIEEVRRTMGDRRKFPQDLPKAIDNYKRGNTLLHIAASMDCWELIKSLLDIGCDAQIRNFHNETPLDLTCFENRKESIKLLILNIKIENSENIFKSFGKIRNFSKTVFECLKDNNPELFKKLIRYRDENGDTILHVISDVKSAEFVINDGAQINVKNNHDESPLLIACQQRNVQLAQLFLENGAIVNDEFRLRPIHQLVLEDLSILKLLLETEVTLSAVLSDNCIPTAIHVFASQGQLSMCKLLVANGAPVNVRNYPYNVTPLLSMDSYPVYRENVDVYFSNVEFLIEAGADVLAEDNNGVTAIEQVWRKKALKDTDRVRLMHLIVLFNVDQPDDNEHLKMIENLIGDNLGLKRCLHYILEYKTFVSQTFPPLYNLIQACKQQNSLNVCQNLDEMLAEDSINDILHSLNVFEVPVEDYTSTRMLRLSDVNRVQMMLDFITNSVARLTKHCIETHRETKAFDRLLLLKKHCMKYL